MTILNETFKVLEFFSGGNNFVHFIYDFMFIFVFVIISFYKLDKIGVIWDMKTSCEELFLSDRLVGMLVRYFLD